MNSEDSDREREIENYWMNGENERRFGQTDRQTDRQTDIRKRENNMDPNTERKTTISKIRTKLKQNVKTFKLSDGIPTQACRRGGDPQREILFAPFGDCSRVFHDAHRRKKAFAALRLCCDFWRSEVNHSGLLFLSSQNKFTVA
jgi:hypothetical protein